MIPREYTLALCTALLLAPLFNHDGKQVEHIAVDEP